MKLLAIDFGMKRLGFAVGSLFLRTATPIPPLHRKNNDTDIEHIRHLIDEYDISKIIIGYPYHMDGTKSDTGQKVEAFAQQVTEAAGVPIEYIDERLTSFEAEEKLKSHQPDYKKRKKILDSISALVILENYMEHEAHS